MPNKTAYEAIVEDNAKRGGTWGETAHDIIATHAAIAAERPTECLRFLSMAQLEGVAPIFTRLGLHGTAQGIGAEYRCNIDGRRYVVEVRAVLE